MTCSSCGERLPLSARTCFNCGAAVAPPVLDAIAEPEPAPARRQPPPAWVRIAARNASVLDRPFGAARRVEAPAEGVLVRVLGESLGFYQVELNDGRRGFVSQDACQPAQAPATPPPPPVPWPVAPAASATPAREVIAGGIVLADGEAVRFRAQFVSGAPGEQALVVTDQRVVLHGCVPDSPMVLSLDAVSVVHVVADDEEAEVGAVAITMLGVDAITVHDLYQPHEARNAILAAGTERKQVGLRPAS